MADIIWELLVLNLIFISISTVMPYTMLFDHHFSRFIPEQKSIKLLLKNLGIVMAKVKPQNIIVSELPNQVSFELSKETNPIIIQQTLRNAIAKTGQSGLSELSNRLSVQFSKETNPIIIQQSLEYAINNYLVKSK